LNFTATFSTLRVEVAVTYISASARSVRDAVSPVNIMDRGISDFLCDLHRLWIVCKASLEALEELLHHLCRYAISYGLMRAEAVVVRLD
jgi:hypothetical protein